LDSPRKAGREDLPAFLFGSGHFPKHEHQPHLEFQILNPNLLLSHAIASPPPNGRNLL
jgi:hypothetical protein